MVTAKLQGGLGNQMFQISAAISLALKNDTNFTFDFDECFTPNQGNPSNIYRENIFKRVTNKKNIQIKNIFRETKCSFTEIKYSEDIMIDGYFQSEKYFYEFREQIKNIFHLEKKNIGFSKPITSVHIRRGDYLQKSKYHNMLDKSYYQDAINLIGEGTFLFFSDDLEWVKKNFKSSNFIFSESINEVEDLELMCSCDNNIIANSSFSWWGAYLNKNNLKRVISPSNEKWFGVDGPKDTQDIIPESWIQI